MDILQFLASVVGSIAWPVTVILVLILFRQKLIELLPWLELDVKGLKFRFRSAEEEAVKISLTQPALIESSATPEETSKFDEIAKLSPRVAVLELAYELEEAVRGFAGAMGIDRNTWTTTLRGLIRLLRSNNLIDQQTSALLDDLNAIGNTAKHGHEADLSKEDAVRFRNLAQIAINQLHIGTAAAQLLGQPAPLP